MKKVYLKVKIKSLAEEIKIIKKEEKKYTKRYCGQYYNAKWEDTRESLYCHRISIVKKEIRAAGLAYAYIRGRKYRQIERSCHTLPDAKRIMHLVNKFSTEKLVSVPDILAWLKEPYLCSSTETSEKEVVERETA